MTGSRLKPAIFVGLFLSVLAATLQGVQGEEQLDPAPAVPEDLCRPYIEKALKGLGTGSLEQTSAEVGTEEDGGSREEGEQPSQEKDDEVTASEQQEDEKSAETEADDETKTDDESVEATGTEEITGDSQEQAESAEAPAEGDEGSVEVATESVEVHEEQAGESQENETQSEEAGDVTEETQDEGSDEKVEDQQDSGEGEADAVKSDEDTQVDDEKSVEDKAEDESSDETKAADDGKSDEEKDETADDDASKMDDGTTSKEEADSKEDAESQEVEDGTEAVSGEISAEVESAKDDESHPEGGDSGEAKEVSAEGDEAEGDGVESDGAESDGAEGNSIEGDDGDSKPATEDESTEDKTKESDEKAEEDEAPASAESQQQTTSKEESEGESEEVKSRATRDVDGEPSGEETASAEAEESADKTEDSMEAESKEEEEPTPEEDLIQEIEIPENLRPREHINQLLKLDEENEEKERAIGKAADVILRELKKVYDNAIKPLETLYKYRDLSNRHFGDPEIFSKPLVLFMGPWSGGKSSIINYLLDIEYKHTSLRTGAEPSPAYFNILMHGEEEEILDGTQLAADWTFSGLQKFGQGLLDRLRGLRLNNKLLEKVNIVEIPGILEIRKQVQRLFPFNDACQWFIDRADIIFLVYDPSKLDVGPETEAILDQLKGREYQTRIILNKADQVKPEELMRVQGALIWNISPLMSSAEPPIMYSTSLWSMPYEAGAPTRLLYAQERAFLRDLRSAVDKRVEHKIASARRFAVRVRNHAKMVDCYLTTYYNHKTFFGNKKEISDKIIENPQDYHIYEGLSTLTNISRYDLPDPDVYRDFFRLNPLFDFPLLSSTCTYFRGCPINRLDVAIAYDLPELVGKYKKSVEAVLHESETSSPSS